MKNKELTLNDVNNFLTELANMDKVGIRRKLLAIKNFLKENGILLNEE